MRIKISFIAMLFFVLLSCRETIDEPTTEVEPDVPKLSTFKITSPSEAENWYPGSTYEIKWLGSEIAQMVDILLYKKNDLMYTLKTRFVNKNTYKWTIPLDIRQSHHYKIKIVNSNNSTDYGLSSTFYIKSF
ncbi:MAG: Ser-Thr-rich GPI-anchored membrane family protein [bacterium]